jgi:uncharacterized membrane protein YphA (DoxX/SURF4 family)
MSQILLAAHAVLSTGHPPTLHSVVDVAAKLPKPKPKVTIPVIVIFAVLLLIGLLRKLVALAVIAAVVCIGFLAYQSGALNHWVDKGKQAIQQQK